MYHYALVSFLIFAASILIPLPEYSLIIILGSIIFLNGLIHLYRFTQEYPLENVQKNE
jgi:membrane protein DedA with SNARE-associated domain